MNLKMILAATLLVLIVVGMIVYGYIMYAINSDTNGKALITTHKMLVYGELVIMLLQFAVSGLVVYKS